MAVLKEKKRLGVKFFEAGQGTISKDDRQRRPSPCIRSFLRSPPFVLFLSLNTQSITANQKPDKAGIQHAVHVNPTMRIHEQPRSIFPSSSQQLFLSCQPRGKSTDRHTWENNIQRKLTEAHHPDETERTRKHCISFPECSSSNRLLVDVLSTDRRNTAQFGLVSPVTNNPIRHELWRRPTVVRRQNTQLNPSQIA